MPFRCVGVDTESVLPLNPIIKELRLEAMT